MQTKILGVGIDKVTMAQAIDKIKSMIHQGGPHLVVTANSEMVMLANHDPLLYQVIERADLVVADGIGVVWASRLLGNPLAQRVPGIELTDNLMAQASEEGWRVYILGAESGVAEVAANELVSRYPRLQVVGSHHGFFTKDQEDQVFDSIKAGHPDILLIALGIPKQEKWAAAHVARLGVPVTIGVGGTINVLAGVDHRAPVWMQRCGLEWLYRLIKQPWRAGRMGALPQFALWVILEKMLVKR